MIPFMHHIVAYKLLLFPIYFGIKNFCSFGYANVLYLINEKNNLIFSYDTMMNNWHETFEQVNNFYKFAVQLAQ